MRKVIELEKYPQGERGMRRIFREATGEVAQGDENYEVADSKRPFENPGVSAFCNARLARRRREKKEAARKKREEARKRKKRNGYKK